MARLSAPRPLSCHDGGFVKIRNIEIEPKKVRSIRKVRSNFAEMDDVFTMADLDTPVKENEESRVRLRRRKSLPTMRRKTDTYQTLPLPRKSKSTKSESKIATDDLAVSPRKTLIEHTFSTLSRKGSMRKAKVQHFYF